MLKARVFTFSLFIISVAVAFGSVRVHFDFNTYIKAIILYWVFSLLYHHLRVISKKGNSYIDYGINYSLSFGLFAGPLGVLLFETIYRFSVYVFKKLTKTADPTEFYDTFYNIGSFTLNCSIAYHLFHFLYPSIGTIPFGLWIIMCLLVIVISLLSDIYLIIYFFLMGEIHTRQEIIDFIKSRSVLDMGKTVVTNGLLFLLLLEEKWEMMISLFILNYLVSRSYLAKAQNIQNKIERDKFEQMAYTDFLTEVSNRAFMDKKMTELNETEECIGIVVADIDKFKQINDAYNHAVGDRVIKHFANTLRESVDTEDLLFRSGGEEFTIFLRNRTFEESVRLIETLLLKIEVSSVDSDYQEKPITVAYTASFGLYYFKVSKEHSMEKAYVQADQLMLQSKELGRNKVSAKNGLSMLEISTPASPAKLHKK